MRQLTGIVKSNKMQKTLVVKVDRLKKYPKYQKYYRVSKSYKAHAENPAEFNVGDLVLIKESRPYSREKRWRVVKTIKRIRPEAGEAEQ